MDGSPETTAEEEPCYKDENLEDADEPVDLFTFACS
jgi:hypothetical protein